MIFRGFFDTDVLFILPILLTEDINDIFKMIYYNGHLGLTGFNRK